ncbi:MAG: hypothetical protein SFY80_08885 [Verrucomicrobiota bacterium]|nr:hypothetical protein [Verrucomicrobiota bacterium]
MNSARATAALPAWVRMPAVARTMELAGYMALSVFAPFLTHFLPVMGDARWGERLLPLYYAPLLAALRSPLWLVAVLSLAAPWVNFAISNSPPPPMAMLLTVQLTAFALGIRWMRLARGEHWWLPLAGYLVAVAMGAVLLLLWPELNPRTSPAQFLLRAFTIPWPGLLVLLGLTWLTRRIPPNASAA